MLTTISSGQALKDRNDTIDRQNAATLLDVLTALDEMKARVESGETVALLMVELPEEIGEWRTHLLGLGDYDHFTVTGILEMTKLQVLDSVYDE